MEGGMEASPSNTAIMAAMVRAQHRLLDDHPWVLDDPFALLFVGAAREQLEALLDAVFPEVHQRQMRTAVSARSRFAEDRLTGGAFTQYVALGAGLDSLAWRRPDLLRSLTMFEVDHPASQAWKQQRVDDLGLPQSPHHVFVPIDFEVESLQAGLDAAGFDWVQPTLFSWLGVVMYLTDDAVEATLRTVAACAGGSEVVFTYRVQDSELDKAGREIIAILEPLAAQFGEPFQPGRSAKEIEALVAGCGLRVAALPAREEIVDRYFADRTDGLVPWTPERLAVAAVP
jgi:methyltransferase (TIGR00027 family)